jgi:hypothetical protein
MTFIDISGVAVLTELGGEEDGRVLRTSRDLTKNLTKRVLQDDGTT